MEPAVPLVFVGDIKGDLAKALGKLQKVQGSMSTPENEVTIFVCGDFFGDVPPACQDYINGSKKVPTHMYILGATCERQFEIYSKLRSEMCEVMTNVTYLGQYGVLTLAEGLTIAYLSGVEGSESKLWTFTEENVNDLIQKCSLFNKIDVLVTYQWPCDVEKSKPDANITVRSPSKLIGRLVAAIMPRLHFSASEQTSFVSPYMTHENDSTKTTVFTGLTSLEKYKEGKWVYGIKLPIVDKGVPSSETVLLPFAEAGKIDINSIFFDAKGGSKRKGPSTDPDSKKRRNLEVFVDPKSCWFCMGNPDIDSSLIIAVADHVYMTLAKGPVVEDHVIILPIKHIEKMTDAPSGVEIETHRFLESMTQYYATKGKQLVWFERCFKSPHLQINAIPVDPHHVSCGVIDKHLSELAQQKQLEARLFNLRTVVNLRKNISSPYYFYLQIGVDRGYLINITKESDFPINFGRRILAQTLGMPHREFWKNCIEDDVSVFRSVSKFRNDFEPYNFTLTD